MRTISILSSALLFAACGTDEVAPVVEHVDGYVIEGELPEGTNLDEVLASVPEGGFGVVADATTGKTAIIMDESSPLARSAAGGFSVTAAATCPDCGTACTAGATRTIDISLTQSGGAGGITHSVVTASSFNFFGASTTPSSFAGNVGQNLNFSTSGTVGSCGQFGYFFDIEAPARVFLTSTNQNGNLGGLAGADAICQARATAASLGGTWRAWLSTSTTNASTRVGSGPWHRVGDFTKVADDIADLTDGTLDAQINRNESGAIVATSVVFTGTTTAGNVTANTCNNWTSTAGQGGRGSSGATGATWTQNNSENCANSRRLYCFEL